VQIIKKDPTHGGILEFGTELVGSADNSIIAMLGASPGASTAVAVMVHVVERCFPKLTALLPEFIPSYGQNLITDTALTLKVRAETAEVLHI
jgi:malate dehydrogenase (quinone)